MIKCAKCGTELEAEQKFCFNCGTPVSKVKKCKNCGREISINMKFCPECGAEQDIKQKPAENTFSDSMEILDKEKFKQDVNKVLTENSDVLMQFSLISIFALNELKALFTKPRKIRILFSKDIDYNIFDDEFAVSPSEKVSQKEILESYAQILTNDKISIHKCSEKNSNSAYPTLKIDKTIYTFSPHNSFDIELLEDKDSQTSQIAIQKMNSQTSGNFYNNLLSENWKNSKDIKENFISFLKQFKICQSIENSYTFTLKKIFGETLDAEIKNFPAISFKNSEIYNMLFDFQKDAVRFIIDKLNKYNVCILADSVGLGKTFSALGVIKYFESKNKNVLVICPKKLQNNWSLYQKSSGKKTNPLKNDSLRYGLVFHTDLNRDGMLANGTKTSDFDWDNYDLVVIDESHNFRNGTSKVKNKNGVKKMNRYDFLADEIVRKGCETKLLLLSATPVNNRFNDLKNQLDLSYECYKEKFDKALLNTQKSYDQIFKSAEKAFTKWAKQPDRTSSSLVKQLDQDFFELLNDISVARSRKHIEKFYDKTRIGTFPERIKPLSISEYSPREASHDKFFDYQKIYTLLSILTLSVYKPSSYLKPGRIEKYSYLKQLTEEHNDFVNVREQGTVFLMRSNLMKRLESSIFSFKNTVEKINNKIVETIKAIDEHKKNPEFGFIEQKIDGSEDDYDEDDIDDISDTINRKSKGKLQIRLEDIDCDKLRRDLVQDNEIFKNVQNVIANFSAEKDAKFQKLLELINNKISNPINPGNKKVIIFTAFADTAFYLYENLIESEDLKTAVVTGTSCKSTVGFKDFEDILCAFSPKSKTGKSNIENEIDILVATDCISEGQNLQDCDYLINYDIHWNPVRIVQRFGRIDRIGSKNTKIQMVNFWPPVELDLYIKLKTRVLARMTAVDIASTGDGNLFSDEKLADYRERQILDDKNIVDKDQEDIETRQIQSLHEGKIETNDTFSITDIGTDSYRMELLENLKTVNVENLPDGIYSVLNTNDENEFPKGFIFVFCPQVQDKKKKGHNFLFPYQFVYVKENGQLYKSASESNTILKNLRILYLNRDKDDTDISEPSPDELKNLKTAVEVAEKSFAENEKLAEVNSLFTTGGTAVHLEKKNPLELVSYFIVR